MSDEPTSLSLPTGIQIQGRKYGVKPWRNWNAVLVFTAEILYERHGHEFLDRLLEAKASTGHPYALRNADKLRRAVRVWKTCVYIETDLNASQTRKRIEQLMKIMEYPVYDLEYRYD